MKLSDLFAKTKPGDVGIIGKPLDHSLSPLMHNAAFQTWWGAFRDKDEPTPHYHKFPIEADQLEEAVALAKKHELRGLNVTVPYKVEACNHVTWLDSFSKKVGAINTISFNVGKSKGFNTDGDGFRRVAERDMNFEAEGKPVLVLGAGGTGRVIVQKLLEMGAKVLWWNRHPEKMKELMTEKEELYGTVQPCANEAEVSAAMKEANLVVNATSVGLSPEDGMPAPGLSFQPSHLVFDVVYHRETRFMQEAKAAGAQVFGGLEMLVYQGATAFEIWTGAPAPKEIMWAAITKSIREENLN